MSDFDKVMARLSNLASPQFWPYWDKDPEPGSDHEWLPKSPSELGQLLREAASELRGATGTGSAEIGARRLADVLETSAVVLDDRDADKVQEAAKIAKKQAKELSGLMEEIVKLVEFVRDIAPALEGDEVLTALVSAHKLSTKLDLDVEDRKDWTFALAGATLVDLMKQSLLDRIQGGK